MTHWPDGHSHAVTMSFDFDAEELWIAEDPANASRPGVLSQGTFGPKVAMPLILEMLARHEVAATFYIPGRDAERHPDVVRRIIDAGHEVAHHGYTHRSPSTLTREEEASELIQALQVLRDLGADVVGYRSPSWDLSPHTLDLLVEHGFQYSSNLMDDITPYRHPDHDLIELCVSWLLDDAPHFWFDSASWTKTMRTPREVHELWSGEIAGIARLGGHAMLTAHPQIIGRPSRLAMLDTLLGELRETDAWIAPARAVADAAR